MPVVATGRDAAKVADSVGTADDLFAVRLDITDPDSAAAAVDAAVERFGRIDVLVNNAGNFYAGFFEELPADDFRSQLETNVFGTVNVTRAVLPVMRAQRSGLVVSLSSTAGIVGSAFTSAYVASKFAVEGWMEALTPEVESFGICTMIIEPGFFRTELLEDASTVWPEPTIDDYAETTRQTVAGWKQMNGKQGGDPAELAAALV
jgi:NAD(P)-dependent dehydrogenase (short-subunit alcohol dehydrogenase family)